MKAIFWLSAIFSIIALLAITIFLLSSGIPTIAKIGFFEFIFGMEWKITGQNQSFGIFPMIVGSIYVTAFSSLTGLAIGLLTAIFLFEFCPKKYVKAIRQMINILAGIPSVLFGMIGLNIIVPLLRSVSPNGVGQGILAATIVLTFMILPTIVSISLDALNAVPKNLFEGALALGANREQAVFKVSLPAAKSGVCAAIVLAIGRAIGETMAVILVIGGSPEMPTGLFQSVRTMTANIAMGAMELTGDAFDALIATGVVLFVFTLIITVSFSSIKNWGKHK